MSAKDRDVAQPNELWRCVVRRLNPRREAHRSTGVSTW